MCLCLSLAFEKLEINYSFERNINLFTCHTMQEIIEKCTQGGVALCETCHFTHENCGIRNPKYNLLHKHK